MQGSTCSSHRFKDTMGNQEHHQTNYKPVILQHKHTWQPSSQQHFCHSEVWVFQHILKVNKFWLVLDANGGGKGKEQLSKLRAPHGECLADSPVSCSSARTKGGKAVSHIYTSQVIQGFVTQNITLNSVWKSRCSQSGSQSIGIVFPNTFLPSELLWTMPFYTLASEFI